MPTCDEGWSSEKCPHGVYPYAECEYCDEVYRRCVSYLVEQKYVIFGQTSDLSDPAQVDTAAQWLADVILAVVPEAGTGASMAVGSTGEQEPT